MGFIIPFPFLLLNRPFTILFLFVFVWCTRMKRRRSLEEAFIGDTHECGGATRV